MGSKRTDRRSPDFRAIAAILTGLALAGTLLIRIPIPTGGYFHVGDSFIILAGLWTGPNVGFIVGAIGPSLADALSHPEFILATFITKGSTGIVVGLLSDRGRNISYIRQGLAASSGGLVIVIGYFFFEAFVYPWLGDFISFFDISSFSMAIVELAPNIMHSIFNVLFGFLLWKIVDNLSVDKAKNNYT